MTEKELHKLKRGELLEMMLAQSREIESLQARIEELEKQLADKEIRIQESGSIAEAALKLNGIFEAAQAAEDQYLENIGAGNKPRNEENNELENNELENNE